MLTWFGFSVGVAGIAVDGVRVVGVMDRSSGAIGGAIIAHGSDMAVRNVSQALKQIQVSLHHKHT